MATLVEAPIVLSSSPGAALPPIHEYNTPQKRRSTPPSSPLPSPSQLARVTGPQAAQCAIIGDAPSSRKDAIPALAVTESHSRHFARDVDLVPTHVSAVYTTLKGTKRKRATQVPLNENGDPKPRKRAPSKEKVQEAVDGSEAAQNTVVPSKRKRRTAKPTDAVALAAVTTGGEEVSHHFGAKTARREERSAEPLGIDAAIVRRRSWTPTLPATGCLTRTTQGEDQADQDETVAFKSVVASFSHAQQIAAPAVGPSNLPGLTRRRKLDSAEPTVVGLQAVAKKPRAPKKVKESKSAKVPTDPAASKSARARKEPKAPKAPKAPQPPKIVRPKTVTDFAIAAYRKPAEEAGPSDVQMTTFFKPTATQVIQLANDPAQTLEPDSIKPVAKKDKRASIQFNFPPPEKAKLGVKNQDFMFGTSSQLAKDDSPRTLRMMQQAYHESEDLAFASQTRSSDVERSPYTSKAKVAAAPHGTTLTLGERNLWAVAARDEDERMFVASQRAPISPDRRSSHGRSSPLLPAQPFDSPHRSEIDDQGADDSPDIFRRDEILSKVLEDDKSPHELHDSGFVDISDLNSSQVSKGMYREPSPEIHVRSDPPSPAPSTTLSQRLGEQDRPALQVINLNAPTATRFGGSGLALKATPIMLSPSKPGSTKSKKKQDAEVQTIAKKPRGRPRKDVTTTDKAASQPATSTKKASKPTATTKRGAPKTVIAPTTPKKRGRPSKTQPITTKDWADIDEISDSEASISTPSPRRRLADSPSQEPPLALELSPAAANAGHSVADHAAALHQAVVDSREGQHEQLFKTITTVVKGAPRSAALDKPSWYEKILLYDPIVLEDLTDWLIDQGVKPDGSIVSMDPDDRPLAELSVKAKGKGRKLADDDGFVELDEAAEPATTKKGKVKSGKAGKGKGKVEGAGTAKTFELQPWEVQKWCESKSICCLWKAGLRGGVRLKY